MGIEFGWTDEHRALREAVRDFCTEFTDVARREEPAGTREGFDRSSWEKLGAELDVLGLAVDTEHGGSGAGLVELGVVAEEFGRALFSSPLLSTVGLSMTALAASKHRAAKDLLERLVKGRSIATMAITPESGLLATEEPPLVATARGDRWVLDGVSGYVLDGGAADAVLCYAAAGGEPGLFLVEGSPEGLHRTVLGTLDQERRQACLEFAGVPAERTADGELAVSAVRAAINAATALMAVEQVGIAQSMLDMSVEYAGTRVQFGRAIGSFQAVKHRCADMYVAVEEARSTADHALWSIDQDSDDHGLASSLAHTVCAKAARKVTAEAIQVHGGTGFTWEHPAHRYFKRAVSNQELFGGRRFHGRRLAEAVLGEHVLGA